MQIKEVSERFQLSQDTLRYYERIGLIPDVPRNASGIRDYNEDSLNWISFIKCMRSAGLSIETLIRYVTLFQQGEETMEERKQLLIDQRRELAKRLEEMQETLQRLDLKIASYDKDITKKEKQLFSHRKKGRNL